MSECKNCEIRPGAAIRTDDMIHCADCGRKILPSSPSYAELQERILSLMQQLKEALAIINVSQGFLREEKAQNEIALAKIAKLRAACEEALNHVGVIPHGDTWSVRQRIEQALAEDK